MAQFMQVSMSNHKSTESAMKNLEIQVAQLAKQIAKNSSRSFGENTEKNPKEEYKAVTTRSKKVTMVEDEGRNVDDQELVAKGEGGKEKEEDQERKKINDEKEKEKGLKRVKS